VIAGVMMARLLERFRFVVIVGVITLAVTTTATLCWSAALAVQWIVDLVGGEWRDTAEIVELLQVIDVLLIATVQLIVGIGLYELFVAPLAVPAWLRVASLAELKVAVAELVVLVIAVKFVELLAKGTDGDDLLSYGAATALVGLMLVALVATTTRKAVGGKQGPGDGSGM
jgi:uncharacterized membrane protein YqhA